MLWARTFQSIALCNGYYYYQRNTLLQIIIAKFTFCTHRSLPSLTSTPPTSRLIWMARSMPGRAWPCCLLWTKRVSTRPWRRSTQISPRQRVSVGQGRLSRWWGHSSTTTQSSLGIHVFILSVVILDFTHLSSFNSTMFHLELCVMYNYIISTNE